MTMHASGRQSAHPYLRRPAPAAPVRTVGGAQRRRPAGKPSAKVATRAADQAADRELTAWFERAAAESPLPTETSFGKLGLPQALVTALERRDIRTAFPIQAATLADCLAGHDVLGRAQTGSGKTLAFGLPMLTRLAGRKLGAAQPRAAWCWCRPASSPCRCATPSSRSATPSASRPSPSSAAPPSAARSRPSSAASTSSSPRRAGCST